MVRGQIVDLLLEGSIPFGTASYAPLVYRINALGFEPRDDRLDSCTGYQGQVREWQRPSLLRRTVRVQVPVGPPFSPPVGQQADPQSFKLNERRFESFRVDHSRVSL